jgi:hypothetical protein
MKRGRSFTAIYFVLLLNLALPLDPPINAQAGIFRYAYVTYDRSFPVTTIKLNSIDPAILGESQTLLTIPAPTIPVPNTDSPAYLWFCSALPSPNGEHIAIRFCAVGGGWSAAEVIMVNVVSGKTYNITDHPVILYNNDLSTMEYVRSIEWSPDSRYLALDMLFDNGKLAKGGPNAVNMDSKALSSAIFAYSLETQHLIDLGSDKKPGVWSTWFAWSNDSKYIATATITYNGTDYPPIAFDIYDIADRQKSQSIPVQLSPDLLALPQGLCFVRWSPDNLYLSFVSDCDYSYSRYKNVFIADVASGKITQITDYKLRLGISRDDAASSYPEPVWFDAQTLLVGARIWRGVGAMTHLDEITAYQWPIRNERVVNNRTAATEWALNSVTNEVAYLESTSITDTGPINGDSKINSLQISSFDGQRLTPKFSLPATWGSLSWSPNGTMLAYNVDQADSVIFHTSEGANTY